MNNRLAVSLIAASLLAPSAAFAQSTTAEGAAEGAARGGEAAGPVGAIVGGTVGAAVGAAVEIPNAVITSIPRDRSVVVREEIVVGEPLCAARTRVVRRSISWCLNSVSRAPLPSRESAALRSNRDVMGSGCAVRSRRSIGLAVSASRATRSSIVCGR